MGSLKRRKVKTSPNLRFVEMEAICRAKIKVGEIEDKLADKEGSKGLKTPESCIVVGSDESDSDDKVEG
jgi:hypothetical protein